MEIFVGLLALFNVIIITWIIYQRQKKLIKFDELLSKLDETNSKYDELKKSYDRNIEFPNQAGARTLNDVSRLKLPKDNPLIGKHIFMQDFKDTYIQVCWANKHNNLFSPNVINYESDMVILNKHLPLELKEVIDEYVKEDNIVSVKKLDDFLKINNIVVESLQSDITLEERTNSLIKMNDDLFSSTRQAAMNYLYKIKDYNDKIQLLEKEKEKLLLSNIKLEEKKEKINIIENDITNEYIKTINNTKLENDKLKSILDNNTIDIEEELFINDILDKLKK